VRQTVSDTGGESAKGAPSWTQYFISLSSALFHNKPPTSQSSKDRSDAQQDVYDLESQNNNNPVVKKERHLQLCITRQKKFMDTTYCTINLDVKNDGELYEKLHSQYIALLGFWGRLLSLKKIGHIRFVKV
jgi:hypothetical protein